MESKYLARAAVELVDRANLNAQNKKIVEEQELQIKILRQAEAKAVSAIKTDVANKKLTEAEGIIEKAQVNAVTLTEVKKAEAEILKVFPSWTSTAGAATKQAIENSSKFSVKTGEFFGKVLGNEIIKTPYQTVRGFVENVKKGVNNKI